MKSIPLLILCLGPATFFAGPAFSDEAWQVTRKAWDALGKKNFDEVERLANESVRRWGERGRKIKNGPSRIWINGWLIKRPMDRGNESVIQLNQGWNQILLENESLTTGKGANDNTWQFRMNLMHPLGMGQVPGLSNFTNNAKPNAQ